MSELDQWVVKDIDSWLAYGRLLRRMRGREGLREVMDAIAGLCAYPDMMLVFKQKAEEGAISDDG